MSLLENILDKLFRHVEIMSGCEGSSDQSLYLKRWFIWGKETSSPGGFRVMVHKICRSDEDVELHDHPWPFLSIIMRRGYIEESIIGYRDVPTPTIPYIRTPILKLELKRPGMFLFRSATWRHRVLLFDDRPAWTLIFTKGKVRSWGFWRGSRFIPWRDFLLEKCLPKPLSDECRKRGWFTKHENGLWLQAQPEEPGAIPDVNRLKYLMAVGEDGLYQAMKGGKESA